MWFFEKFEDNITCGDDDNIRFGKLPDLFLFAWKKFGSPPAENCLVFEDSYNGAQAEKAAGMKVSFIIRF